MRKILLLAFVLKHTDPYGIDSISADLKSETRLAMLKKLVDKAVRQKAAVVFRAHSMYGDKKGDMGDFLIQTSSKLFDKFVQYCVKKGCRIVTMVEFMELYT
jgi:hypothetical protein